jgi:hypothetical protein
LYIGTYCGFNIEPFVIFTVETSLTHVESASDDVLELFLLATVQNPSEAGSGVAQVEGAADSASESCAGSPAST